MRYVFLLLLISFAFAEDETKVPVTPEVQKILDARQKEIDAAAVVYAQATIKSNEKASKALEAVVKAKTQKGDLEGALAAKNILDQWKKENQEASNQILLGQEEPTDPAVFIVGKWVAGDIPLTINKDKTWSTQWANLGGTWRVVKGQVELTANKGNNQVILIEPKVGAKWIFNWGNNGGPAARVAD